MQRGFFLNTKLCTGKKEMSCVPGCLCSHTSNYSSPFFDSGTRDCYACTHPRAQHKGAKLCLGSYECTCSASRYEEFAFERGVCLDPTCGHVRSRHHGSVPEQIFARHIPRHLDRAEPGSRFGRPDETTPEEDFARAQLPNK